MPSIIRAMGVLGASRVVEGHGRCCARGLKGSKVHALKLAPLPPRDLL